VSSMTFLVLCSAALGADNSDSLQRSPSKGHANGPADGGHVSTEWVCPLPGDEKKHHPAGQTAGPVAGGVVFAVVNPDRDRDLANQLTGGGPIPQLVMYRKTSNGGCGGS